MALISSSVIRDNVAQGSTSQRPSGAKGMLRYNTNRKCLEYYDGSGWICGVRSHEVHNGSCNVTGSSGVIVSGGSFTANQSGNTSRKIEADVTWLDNKYDHPINSDSVTVAVCNFRISSGNISGLQAKNVSAVSRVSKGRYRITMSNTGITNTKYAVTCNWTGTQRNSNRHVKINTKDNASGVLSHYTTTQFDIGCGGDGNYSDDVGLVNLSVVK